MLIKSFTPFDIVTGRKSKASLNDYLYEGVM